MDSTQDHPEFTPDYVDVNPLFARPAEETLAPRYTLAAGQMLPETAYQIVHHLSDRLRIHGRLVPAYRMPDDLAEMTVQRIVVRNGLSMDLPSRFSP
jgi:glutamate/tyrosine decarboxylase-like PLP-dependent enzyme